MSKPPASSDHSVGYGRAPEATRFQKGRSGNPKGRRKGSKKLPPYEAVLGQMVTVQEGGKECRISAADAFVLHVVKLGLDGDGPAARAALAAIANERASRGVTGEDELHTIVRTIIRPGSVNRALEPLRMAVKLDSYRPTARMVLEPWLVEAALLRLGDRRLSREEQDEVVRATRMPDKVRWPDWWQVRP